MHRISGDGYGRDPGRSANGRGSASIADPLHDKAAYIEDLAGKGRRVAVVGDGINDAPAMSRADVALAVHSGARPLARQAGDVTLMRERELMQVLDFIQWARQVQRKIRQNLWWAWLYNLVGYSPAMSGQLMPLVAVTAMLLSSLSLIGNTRLLTWPAVPLKLNQNSYDEQPAQSQYRSGEKLPASTGKRRTAGPAENSKPCIRSIRCVWPMSNNGRV